MGIIHFIEDKLLKIRLLFITNKEPYLFLTTLLGFIPKDISIYQTAFTHKSKSKKRETGNNERLEFLGDAVIDVVASDFLFHKYKNKKEGFLTKERAKIVQRETLNKIAVKLGIDKKVKTAGIIISPHVSIYGNALEALVGAIYIDKGYSYAQKFIIEKIIRTIDEENLLSDEKNYKSTLLEWSQKNKVDISIITEDSEEKEKNFQLFISYTLIDGIKTKDAKGFSKKESQQKAASFALEYIKKTY